MPSLHLSLPASTSLLSTIQVETGDASLFKDDVGGAGGVEMVYT